MRKLIAELKRRNVFKVAIVYLAAAWLMMQVVDVMFPALGLQPWTVTLAIALLLIGFPIALAMAWAFELTPGSIRRETAQAKSADGVSTPAQGPSPARLADAARPTEEHKSIAVLPFLDMSPDRNNEYFSDGMTEELLNVLARIPDLRVASRTSCFALKGKDLDIHELAERLNVGHVLEGSVRKAGDRLRITAQLIEAGTDSHLWSESYDRKLDDIFAIQDDIARKIGDALKLRFHTRTRPHTTPSNTRAYDLYLRGLSFLHRFGPKSLGYAIDMFRRSTEADPGFAPAWAAMANAHATMAIYYSGGTTHLEAADEASRRAVEHAPELAEAHSARALFHLARRNYDDAAKAFERAIELNPRLFDTWYQYARTAVHQGRMRRALELFEKAAEVNPEDYQGPLIAAPIYRSLGDEENARKADRRGVALAERHLEDYPDNARAYFLASAALLSLGERDKAFEWSERALAIDPDDPSARYNVACFYAQAGDINRALDYLETSLASRSWVENDPELEPLRKHPRYRAFIASLDD
ncbi:MAG: tetratricopeptide repeat protein [Gammaproteobacteria bacterium]